MKLGIRVLYEELLGKLEFCGSQSCDSRALFQRQVTVTVPYLQSR